MKSIYITLVLSFVLNITSAQQFSLGVRSGATYMMDKQSRGGVFRAADGQTTSWEKGIFFRVTGKRLAFESSVSHYSFNANQYFVIICFPNSEDPYCTDVVNEKNDYLELSMGLQYALSKNTGQHFRHYIGLSLIPGRMLTTTEIQSFGYDKEMVSTRKSAQLSIWSGLNYSASYCITKHVFISSELSYKVDPFSYFGSNFGGGQPNNRVGLNIGAGYLF